MKLTTDSPEFQQYLQEAQRVHNNYMDKNFPNNEKKTITYEDGKRYIKVITERGLHDRSSHSFIDKTNGDILKAASWKAPAKHARGNLFVEGWKDSLEWHGVKYLRG